METTLAHYRSRWHLLVSLVLCGAIGWLIWFNRDFVGQGLVLVSTANVWLVAGALLVTMLSYLVSSQVFRLGLVRSDVRIGIVPLWATTITAIVISQLIPAGGVGSYAFFMSVFKRRGVSTSQAAILTGLESVSYLGAMVLLGSFGVVYIAIHTLSGGRGNPNFWGMGIAGFVAAMLLVAVLYVGSRSATTLMKTALAVSHRVLDWAHRPHWDERIRAVVNGFVRERDLLIANPRILAGVVLVQLMALTGHSLALWLVLLSLNIHVGIAVAVATFGTMLILSSFNVLPGGGGTVEAVLTVVLLQFGVGTAAIGAAVLFRLLNYWLLLPVAGLSAAWLLRRRAA